jgi:putative phosphoribosyl transferase
MAIFTDRRDAGKELARHLGHYAQRSDVVVLALPRGGVPVAYEVARALGAPLDIFLVRKLGLPGHEELAMGAIASGGVRVLSDDLIAALEVPQAVVDAVTRREQAELECRERAYRAGRSALDFRGKIVILIDDGLATGSSMRAAVAGVRAQQPARCVVAVPTAAPETCESFEHEVDDLVCAATPQPFYGVGLWYDDFEQVSDDEVRQLLAAAEHFARQQAH